MFLYFLVNLYFCWPINLNCAVEGGEESILADHQHVVEGAEETNEGLSEKFGLIAGENHNVDEELNDSVALDFYDANDGHDEVDENTESRESIPFEQGLDISSIVVHHRISKLVAIADADDGRDDLERALEKHKMKDSTLSQNFGSSSVEIRPKVSFDEDDGLVECVYNPLAESKVTELQDNSDKDSFVASNASMVGGDISISLNGQLTGLGNCNGFVACDFDGVPHKKGQEEDSDGIQVEMVQVPVPDACAPECLPQAKTESSISVDHDAKREDMFDIELVGDAVEPVLNTIVTQSGHVVSADFLEEMIEDAKNNKVNNKLKLCYLIFLIF